MYRLTIKTSNNHSSPPKLAVNTLQASLPRREEYQANVSMQLSSGALSTADLAGSWNTACSILRKAGEDTIGIKARRPNRCHQWDKVMEELSSKMKELRIKIINCNDADQRHDLRTERNQISHQLRRRAKECAAAELDAQVSEIENLKDGAQMFHAVRVLSCTKSQCPVITDENGRTLTQPSEMADRISQHFHNALTDPAQDSLTADDYQVGPLEQPILPDEVKKAAKRLKNNRAAGPDNIPAELIKYAPEEFFVYLAEVLNQCIETGERLTLNEGVLIPLQKPGKPKGPATSLRPIILLNVFRKILSLVTLARINPRVQEFVSPAQSGF